jgi:hypothetical protein
MNLLQRSKILMVAEGLFHHLERTLVALGFHDPDNPRQAMTRLRRMFSRIRPDTMEVSILRGILTAIGKQTAQLAGVAPDCPRWPVAASQYLTKLVVYYTLVNLRNLHQTKGREYEANSERSLCSHGDARHCRAPGEGTHQPG